MGGKNWYTEKVSTYGVTFILLKSSWQFSTKGTWYEERGKWGVTCPHSFPSMVAKKSVLTELCEIID